MITPGKNGQMEEQIDFSKTSQIKCESCGNLTFKQHVLGLLVTTPTRERESLFRD